MSKTVIFVGYVYSDYLDYFTSAGYTIGFLYDQEEPGRVQETDFRDQIHFAFPVNFTSNQTIIGSLSEVFVSSNALVICILDRYFSSSVLISHLFGLRQAELMSVEQASQVTSKNFQRKVFKEKYPEITINYKKFRTFHGAYTFTRKHGFPVIVKPASLSQSQLVNICHDLEDLIKKVSYVLDHMEQVYRQNHIHRKPEVMIEEYVEGRQFSVDSYVTVEGEIIHTPICQQTLGHDLGMDNFETLYSMYPAEMSKKEEKLILDSVTKAIESLDIRGQPTHTEVKLNAKGECKIIEVNIRAGGFRANMLGQSYGFDHIGNIIKNYLGQQPEVKTDLLKYSACPQFWPEEEGVLESIEEVEEVEKLESFVSSMGTRRIGKYVGPADKGFARAFAVNIANTKKENLLRDLEAARKLIKLKIV
jgi:hypothetical protein